jgi:hypothetical protein
LFCTRNIVLEKNTVKGTAVSEGSAVVEAAGLRKSYAGQVRALYGLSVSGSARARPASTTPTGRSQRTA